MAKPLIIVSFSVPPEVRKDFTRFYHREFLPKIHEANSADVSNIRRYADRHDEDSLFWDKKQYLTIYQLAGAESAKKANALFEGPAVEAVVNKFREFKDKNLKHFKRTLFVPTWEHPRQSAEIFSGPFLLWQLEIKPPADPEFQKWYHQDLLLPEMADHPGWARCHKYATKTGDQYRHLTFLETEDAATLSQLSDGFAATRIQHNDEWQKRAADVKMTNLDTFHPLYRWPD